MDNYRFDWNILIGYRDFLNQLFSTYCSFSESELIRFKEKLSFGSQPEYYSEGQCGKRVFGLIFNEKITWTERLKNIYYEEPQLLYTGNGNDEYSSEVNFNELPIKLGEELKSIIDEKEHDIMSECGHYLDYPDHREYNNENNENNLSYQLQGIEKFYKNVKNKEIFHIHEIANIIRANETIYIINKNFYIVLINKICLDILDFSIEKFYEKL